MAVSIPVEISSLFSCQGWCWRLQGKGSTFPVTFLVWFPRSRAKLSPAQLPPLTALLAPSLPSFHSFCRHRLVPGDGRERAGSRGSSSTLPSLEVSHRMRRMSLHKYILCRGCGAQPVSLSPCPHGAFLPSVFFSSIFLSLWLPQCCLQEHQETLK